MYIVITSPPNLRNIEYYITRPTNKDLTLTTFTPPGKPNNDILFITFTDSTENVRIVILLRIVVFFFLYHMRLQIVTACRIAKHTNFFKIDLVFLLCVL